jgi:hypothetical protein
MNNNIRQRIQHDLDLLEMAAFNQGFEACINAVDEIANANHNNGYKATSEILRNLVKELTGETTTTNH